jgi:hypothetical protein
MSQAGRYLPSTPAPGTVLFLEGNTGGAVGPDVTGTIFVVGAGNIETVGTPLTDTITVNLVGTTNHAVQIGNAAGDLTSIGVGTNGQALLGSTGADPAFATLTSSGGTITYTTGPHALNLEVSIGKFVETITGDSGGAETPDAFGNFDFSGGTTGLTFAGTSNTETLTGTLIVANGGTDKTSFTAYAPITGGTTTTGALQSAATGISNSGYVLTSNGSSALPSWQAAGINSLVFSTDQGTASPSAGTITFDAVSQAGVSVTFSGSGSTVSLNVTDADDNTTIGKQAGLNTIGSFNTGLGFTALTGTSVGSSNTAIGYRSMRELNGSGATASNNTAVGAIAGQNIVTGTYNALLGYAAGNNYTGAETSNICLNSSGTTSESNVLRIGNGTGTGSQELAAAYISGIQGVNVGSVASVVSIAASGDQLGSTVITAGTGISVTPGANSISISATGSGGIITIDGDTGSATGSTVTFNANSNSGSSVQFVASSATVDLEVTDSNHNTIIGAASGNGSISGTYNVSLGDNCLTAVTSGTENIALGAYALHAIGSGGSNIAIGTNGSQAITSGNGNTTVGHTAGINYTGSESYNILLGFESKGTVGESNVLRIGNGTGTSPGNINASYISGIQGTNVGSVASVVSIASSGDQLGSTVITAGTGITVTPSSNTITISSSGGGGLTWNNTTSSTQAMAANNGYIANDSSSLVTFTLPVTAAQGTSMWIAGNSADGWTIVENSGQSINFGSSSTTVTTGSLSSTNQYDAVQLLCVVANTTFNVLSAQGNLIVM